MTNMVDRKLLPVRRVVTGLDVEGRSTIISDGLATVSFAFPKVPDYGTTELWRTTSAPADATANDPCRRPVTIMPPRNGTVFRMVQFPSDSLFLDDFDPHAAFGALPDGADHIKDREVRNATMHKTDSVDYAVVVKGEIYAVMEAGEVLLRAGDTLVQRGTVHGWSNRTDEVALVAFVLVDAASVAG